MKSQCLVQVEVVAVPFINLFCVNVPISEQVQEVHPMVSTPSRFVASIRLRLAVNRSPSGTFATVE